MLKDGSDSVGALGALNRVYLNIGLFSEEWLLHFRPLIGGQEISPIKIADARKNSVYWQATEQQTMNMARFFLASTDPHYLKDAPGGPAHLTEDADALRRGKTVFAERCARCHSSKLPPLPQGLDMENCNGKDYLGCWDRYWAWTKTDTFKTPMRELALADDFLKDNYLSTELRVPSTLLQTNICSPIATNAIAGNIWDNFSSQSYKELPSVGTVKLRHPLTGAEYDYTLPGGGRGFTRPASLVSLWSTAPFLQNNSVGPFRPESVGRSAHGGVPGVDRTDALARAPAQGRPLHQAEHRWTGRRLDSAHDVGELHQGAQGLRAGQPARAARHRTASVPVPVPER